MNAAKPVLWKRGTRWLAIALVWLLVICLTLWAAAALYFDVAPGRLRFTAPTTYLVLVVALAWLSRRRVLRIGICLTSFLIVLAFWLSLKPSNDRPWQPDLSETPWADINGDRITIHNFRDCSYRNKGDFTCKWLTKDVSLSQLRGVDLFVDYWGSPWIEHPIVSFQFGDDDYVAASIEARYQVGQGYSPIRSFFRQFTLIYVFANERDLIRLRTNYRSGEDLYLYHLVASPEWSRLFFLQYVQEANRLHDHPRWFNAATDNCTTNIFAQMAATGHLPAGSSQYSWWVLLNGRAPEMLYRGGNIAGSLPFPDLKRQAYINPVANTLNDALDFSRRIRMNRIGFEFLQSHEAAPPPLQH